MTEPAHPSSRSVIAGLADVLGELTLDAVLELHAAENPTRGPLVRLWRAPDEIRAELAAGIPADADEEERIRAFGWLPPGPITPRWSALLTVPADQADRVAFASRLYATARDHGDDLLYRHWLLSGGEGKRLPILGLDRLAVTYYARLGETDSVRHPRALARRTEIGYRLVDEELTGAGQWRPTDVIDNFELGRLGDRLVALDESLAHELVRVWPDGLADPADDLLRRAHVERDADGLPSAPGRPRLTGSERHAVARYLREAPVVVSVLGYDPDPFDPQGPAVVPQHIRTDGTWVWSEAQAYFAERYGVPPEAELLGHVRGNGYQLPAHIDDEVLDQAARLAR